MEGQSNTVAVTALTLTRTDTATDADTPASEVRLYHDVNSDGAVDGGDTLLRSGTFASGTGTFAIALRVSDGTPRQLLAVVDIDAAATPIGTLGVQISGVADPTVTAPDQVRPVGFPIQSGQITIAAPAPVIQSATANAGGAGGAGIRAGYQVVILFNALTNVSNLSASDLDAALPLNNRHSWCGSAGAITSAVWGTTTNTNDTLTITLSVTISPPAWPLPTACRWGPPSRM